MTSDVARRYDTVAATFTARAREVPAAAWGNPAPCEGWVARDVVRHLVEWVPAFFSGYAGVDLAPGPSVDDDPVGAWESLDRGLRGLLDDPAVAGRPTSSPGGEATVEEAVDRFVTGDLLVHTWDLARAAGLDETLDADEVRRGLESMAGIGDVLVASGHYQPATAVADDADEQTRLIALTGRTP